MKQLELKKTKGWGGKRKGAGRKNHSGTVAHGVRETVKASTPFHITKRLKRGLKGLRSPRLLKELQQSFYLAKAKGLNVLHFSLQNNHLHMIGESESTEAMASGMNSIGARFGKIVRKRLGGSGSVFDGRYHVKVIKSPRQMRNTLAYVLLNETNHKGWAPEYDEYSSARHFKRFGKLLGRKMTNFLADGRGDPLPKHLSPPKSWLAREGWLKAVA